MPLDPSISLGVKTPAQNNLLSDPAQFNALIGSADALQNMQARQAIGQAYQQATDPDTGKTDYNKLTGIITQDPQAAYRAPEAVTTALAQARAHLENNGISAENWKKQNDNFASVLTPLLTKKDLSAGDIISGIGDLAALPEEQRPVSMPQLIQAATQVNAMGNDPQKLWQYLTQLSLSHQHSEALHGQIFGTPQTVASGGQINQQAVSPVTGVHQLAPPIPITANPGEKMQGTGAVVGGVPTTVPNVARFDNQGNPLPGAPAAATGGPFANGGRYQPAAPATPGGGVAPPAGAPAGSIQSGFPPGQAIAAERTASGSADQGVQLQARSDIVPDRKAALDNMLVDLEHINPGKWSESQQQMETLSQRLTGVGMTMSKEDLAKYESFHKLASQLALQQSGAAHGTDLTTRTAMGANPGPEFSKLGNQQLIGMLKGNEDYITAKNDAWQAWQKNHGTQTYGDFSNNFNKISDPRVFQAMYMSPAQKADLLKTMKSDTERNAFRQKYNDAVRAGWVADPRAANAP